MNNSSSNCWIEIFPAITDGKNNTTRVSKVLLPSDFSPELFSNGQFEKFSFDLETISFYEKALSSIKTCQSLFQKASGLSVLWSLLCFRLSGEENTALNLVTLDNQQKAQFFTMVVDFSSVTDEHSSNVEPPFDQLVDIVLAKLGACSAPATLTELLNVHDHNASDCVVKASSLVIVCDENTDGVKLGEVSAMLYDVVVVITTNESTHLIQVYYNPTKYQHERMQIILDQYFTLINEVYSSSEPVCASTVSIRNPRQTQVLPDPRERLSALWEGSITSHFSKNARLYPNKLAVVHLETKLTYGYLERISNQLANWILAKGVPPYSCVAIYGYRNVCIVWAILGVLSAGCHYTVIDPAYPATRMINCLTVAPPKCWIQIEEAGSVPPEVLDHLDALKCTVRCNLPLPSIAEEKRLFAYYNGAEPPDVQIHPSTIALATFTSGSTGLPKGVLGRHSSLTHFYPWMRETFKLRREDRFSLCSGISHDPLQRDIFTPFYLGSTIFIPDTNDIHTPGRLAYWMKVNGITITHLTPAMGQLLASTSAYRVHSLRAGFFVGDKLTKRDVYNLRTVSPSITCVNMYGSTETQRSVSFYIVPPNDQLKPLKEILPVGKGMKDSQLLILRNTHSMQKPLLAGIGEVGEIFVRSAHLALGYKDLEKVTSERFIKNPFTQLPSDVLYRTGDLGRYDLQGSVDVIGRVDDQVKIRGFRIELGEINSMVALHPLVKENVITIYNPPSSSSSVEREKTIVAYIVEDQDGDDDQPLSDATLRAFLKTKLPTYMIPSIFVFIDKIPLTPNGKIDRKALPSPVAASGSSLDDLDQKALKKLLEEQCKNAVEKEVARCFIEVLGTAQFSVEDSFFEIGGHSLNAQALLIKLSDNFQSISIITLFSAPSVRAISTKLKPKAGVVFASTSLAVEATSEQGVSEDYLNALKPTMVDNFVKELNNLLISTDSSTFSSSSSSLSNASTSSNSLDTSPKINILLTGSTGFLGSFLLLDLLKSFKNAQIFVIVRGSSLEIAKERTLNSLQSAHVITSRTLNKSCFRQVKVMLGDLSKPMFGMDGNNYNQLVQALSNPNVPNHIIHNGAIVHWLLPYSSLEAVNVNGTKEVLKLAVLASSSCHAVRVHFISTTAVVAGEKDTSIAECAVQNPERLEDGYGQTKFIAERLVAATAHKFPDRVRANIFRPAYVSGDTMRGVWTVDDFICRLIKGCIEIRQYPALSEDKAAFNMVPVNVVARTIIAIGLESESSGQPTSYYHVCADRSLPIESIFEKHVKRFYKVEAKPFSQWLERLVAAKQNALTPMLWYLQAQSPSWPESLAQSALVQYQTQNVKQTLAKAEKEKRPHHTDGFAPDAHRVVSSTQYFDQVVEYFWGCGFLKKPSSFKTGTATTLNVQSITRSSSQI